jgi:hypothetical protein
MNETLNRSPSEERSIQNTENESSMMMISDRTTNRLAYQDCRCTSMLKTSADEIPRRPAYAAGRSRMETPVGVIAHFVITDLRQPVANHIDSRIEDRLSRTA